MLNCIHRERERGDCIHTYTFCASGGREGPPNKKAKGNEKKNNRGSLGSRLMDGQCITTHTHTV